MNKKVALVFVVFGLLAIITGGSLSAFTANNSSYVLAWSVAYLVLIVGLVQILLGLGISYLAKHQVSKRTLIATFLSLNLGNAAVIAGTAIKYTTSQNTVLVGIGGLLIVLAMMLFVRMVRGADKSKWLVAYYCLVGVVLASMVVGIILSARSL